MLVDTLGSQLLGTGLESVGPGQRGSRVVAAVDVVVVQQGFLVLVGSRVLLTRSSRVGAGRGLSRGRGPLSRPAGGPGGRLRLLLLLLLLGLTLLLLLFLGLRLLGGLSLGSTSLGLSIRANDDGRQGRSGRRSLDSLDLGSTGRSLGGSSLRGGGRGAGDGPDRPFGLEGALLSLDVDRGSQDTGSSADGAQQQGRTHIED